MENRKKLGAILIGVVLALQTVGCGKTEPPVNSGSTQNDIPASEETGQSSVGAQGNTSGKYPMKTCNKVKRPMQKIQRTQVKAKF